MADRLSTAAARDALLPLKDRLGPDWGRVQNVLQNAVDGETPLSACIPVGDVQKGLQWLASLRSRVNKAAAAGNLDVRFAADTKKRLPPEGRTCWFEGTDQLSQRVQKATEPLTRADEGQPLLPLRGISTSTSALREDKVVVRFTVRCAGDDRTLVDELVGYLRTQFASSKRYQLHWSNQQGSTPVQDGDFALVMVSPKLLEQEVKLPVRAILVGLKRIDLDRQRLEGAKTEDLFVHRTRDGRKQFFFDLTQPRAREAFAHDLYRAAEDRLDGHFDQPKNALDALAQDAATELSSGAFRDWAGAKPHLAIVFTDIKGSTELGRQVGDKQMSVIRRAHFDQARKLIQRFHGWEVKTIGDAFMVIFTSTEEALSFSIALHADTGHEELSIRAGIHAGPMDVEEEDVFGNTVNYAARVTSAVKEAEIWMSDQVYGEIPLRRSKQLGCIQHPDVLLRDFGKQTLWQVGGREKEYGAGEREKHVPELPAHAGPMLPGRGYRFRLSDADKSQPEAAPRGEATDGYGELEAWACDPMAPRFYALLGEYGIGKTTLLKEFTRRLRRKHSGDPEIPLPIYIDLRDYVGDITTPPTLDQLLTGVIERAWKLENRDFTARDIQELVRGQGAVMIFDGLDEKTVHMNQENAKAFIRTLWSVLGESKLGKVLISCRSHYFRDLQDQTAMLTGEDREGRLRRDCPAFCLLPFTEDQIREYLRQHFGNPQRADEAFSVLESIHNLKELGGRPYLLSLIAEQIADLETRAAQGEAINAAALYESLIRRWLDRDSGKHHIERTHKRRLMEDIAAEMWKEGQKQWDADRLEQWLEHKLFQTAEYAGLYSPGDKAVLKEDFRTATFILRPDTEKKHFQFAHTSLQEFFLASYLVRALKDGAPERWSLALVSDETIDFVGQLLQSEGRDARGLECLLEGDDLAAAVQAFGYWVAAVKMKYPVPSPGRVRLGGADLTGWQIRDLNLRGADLRDVRMREARLERVELSGADVRGLWAGDAVFIDVTAEGLIAGGSDLGAPKWRGGSVGGDVRLTRAVRRSPLRGSSFVNVGHSSLVHACAWSPDGRRLLSGSEDQTMKLWDAETGACLRSISGHSDRVRACAWSPDGRRLLSGSEDQTMKLWDAETGACLRTLSGHAGWVSACAWSPDGRRLLSGSGDQTLKLWDAESGACLRTLSGHDGWVSACAWSPDGRRLLSGSGDQTLKLWDAETGACLRTLSGHSRLVHGCAWSPDGRRLLSGSGDQTLKIWDAETGACLRTLSGNSGVVSACAWSPDGRRLLSGSGDQTLKLWDAETGACLRTLSGHAGWVSACAWSPDGRRLLSGSEDQTLKLWDAETGACLRTLSGHSRLVHACAWSPDGRRLLSGSYDQTLKLWDAETGACLRTLSGHSSLVNACAWSPDGRRLLSGSYDQTLKLWDAETGACLRTLSGHSGWVSACAWSPDGRRLLSGSSDRTVKMWDAESGACLRTLSGHSRTVSAGAWSPDGRRLLSGSEDQTLKVWDAETGACLRTLSGHDGSVSACAWSPDGRRLLSGSGDQTLKLWDAETGACLRTLSGHSRWVSACAWSPDGRRLLSGSGDRTVKLWDAESGACLRTLSGHAGLVSACAWSPDGRRLLSGSEDRICIHSARSGEVLWSAWHLPEGNAASIGGNRILWGSPEAWRWLGWQVVENGRTRILPCETFGPVRGISGRRGGAGI